jgi:hypothetical protein
MHVVQGTATVVTGGELRDAREIAPGELRARTVDERRLRDIGATLIDQPRRFRFAVWRSLRGASRSPTRHPSGRAARDPPPPVGRRRGA